MPRADLKGKRFGNLVVLRFDSIRKPYTKKRTYWLCLCDCGKEKVILGNTLVSGLNKSCGCLRFSGLGKSKHGHTHGHKHSRTYNSWAQMKSRCLNPQVKDFKDYGNRNITICDRWKDSFENFLEDMGERPKGLTLERIENSKGYSPDNCKWATRLEQSRNRRNSIRCTYKGKTLSISEWAEIIDVKYDTLHNWITNRGLNIAQCIARKKLLKGKGTRIDLVIKGV